MCNNCKYKACEVCNRKDDGMATGRITEEINHPERYSGKYECIEVMRDTFGDTAVKDFCRLNAFKYLWRSEKKNGIEDIHKALWYLNYLVGMEDKNGEVR